MSKALKALTEKQEAFAQHYALHGDATRAYKVAYNAENSKPESVRVSGAQLLKHATVSLRIQELKKRVVTMADEQFDITAAKVLDELSCMAFYDPTDYFDWDHEKVTIKASAELTKRQRKAITAVTQTTGNTSSIKLEFGNKQTALVTLGKHLGMFKEAPAVTVNNVNMTADAAADFDSRMANVAARASSAEGAIKLN